MKNKIFFILFVFCLLKLYHVADRSLYFSPDLLINSFNKHAGEKESLHNLSDDVIPIRDFLKEKNISKFRLSDEILKNHENYYMRLIEFNYPIKIKDDAIIFVALKVEGEKEDCKLLKFTKNTHIYECK